MRLPPAVVGILFPLLTALLAGVIGWMVRGGWDAGRSLSDQASRAHEVELFTTTTPDAYSVGKRLADGVQDGRQLWYVVTRHENLGTFPDIQGKRHQQWRVWGVPA